MNFNVLERMEGEKMNKYVNVIGGGLAGCEAAYQIAKRGIKVKLYEMKPQKYSPAHSNKNLAEIVCSNSFKSNLLTNACGLLKEELRRLDSLLIKIADEVQVPAGQALAVDRDKFSKKVTETIQNMENIEIINKEVVSKFDETMSNSKIEKNNNESLTEVQKGLSFDAIFLEDLINEDVITIIATGPLTSDSLSVGIKKLTGENELHFYDAAAPIVEKDSIDFSIAFYGDRYDEEKKKDETIEKWLERINNNKSDYINLPMNKEEYEKFVKELINAQVVELHEFEKREIFEGCMPVEIMAKRGIDTLRYGPLKPVGFDDPRTAKRPYAVVQLRQDNIEGTLYNLVGFQTNLKYGEQKRVFSMIPGLENAEFIKYGVMHRNTFINSTNLLNNTYQMLSNKNIFFAGQITGVEGYVESISSGMVAGINAVRLINNEEKKIFSRETMVGALAGYISTPNDKFQPMNANFGIMPKLEGKKIKDKKLRYKAISNRALEILQKD